MCVWCWCAPRGRWAEVLRDPVRGDECVADDEGGLVADGESGAQIYAASAKREQAGILFADAVKMVKQSPALSKRLELSGGAGREFNIAHHPTGSYFRPVSRDTGKTGSGPRPYFVLADEVHELPDRKILEIMERGFKFRREPLLFMITNSGVDRNSSGWRSRFAVCGNGTPSCR